MSGGETPDRGTVSTAARAYIGLVVVAIASFGLPLYLYPSGAPGYWAWTVAEPRTAMLIGSVYFVSTIYYVILFRQRDWIRIEMSLRSLFVVAAWLLVAAMCHWRSFYPYRLQTLSWLGAYYLPLFFLPILFRLHRERFGSDSDPGGAGVAPAWQGWLRARGVVYGTAAVLIFWLAPSLASAWPWPIEPVNLRMFSGQIAVFGAFAGFGMKDGSWRRVELFMLITAMMGVAHLILLAVPVGRYDWSTPFAWPLVLMAFEWLGTSAGMYLAHRPAPHVRSAGPGR